MLNIEIYLYLTNSKKTQKDTCKARPNTLNISCTHPSQASKSGEKDLYLKTALKGELSLGPANLVGRSSDYNSQGYGFEYHCGQEFFDSVFFRIRHASRSSTEPIQMESSMTFIRGYRYIEEMIIWGENGVLTST